MSKTYANFLEPYKDGPYARRLKESRLAGSAPVRMLHVTQVKGPCTSPPTPDFILGLSLNVFRCTFDFGAGRWRGRSYNNDLTCLAPNIISDGACDDPEEMLILAAPASALGPILAEAGGSDACDLGRLHAAPFRDSFVEALCRRLWEEAARGSPLGSLFADSMLQTLALALLRKAGTRKTATGPRPGDALAPWRLRRSLEYINANLSSQISLSELALVSGLSPLYFPKAFRSALGLAPHQYLARQRVERAKQLLRATDQPIADVALACGFCDQSHLTRWFKRIAGVTPAAYRAEQRGRTI